jgi:DNA-binding XRE family transcriptional regulator
MRRTLGTAVFWGMLGVTLFGIFLTPVFYQVLQAATEALFGAKPEAEAGAQTSPLSRRLREMREAAGMSPEALAAASGLSAAFVVELEQGRRDDPHVSAALALANGLGVSLDRLLSQQDAPNGDGEAAG